MYLAITVLFVVLILYFMNNKMIFCNAPKAGGNQSNFHSGYHEYKSDGTRVTAKDMDDPDRAERIRIIEARRKIPNDGYRQPHQIQTSKDAAKSYAMGHQDSVQDMLKADSFAYHSGKCTTDGVGKFKEDMIGKRIASSINIEKEGCKDDNISYGDYVTNLVADERMVKNHESWVNEIKPWSAGPMAVDELNVEDYLHFTGMRRPQPVPQTCQLMVTELGEEELSRNPKFRFNDN